MPKPATPPATPAAFPKPLLGTKSYAATLGLPPPTTTREKLIEAAMELFYTYGFHAVGLDRVLTDVGISKQAFYRHFASKDDLAIEVLQVRDKRETEVFSQAVQARAGLGATPRQLVLAMFDVVDEMFTSPEFHGCIFLTACFEFPSPSDPMHQAAGGHYAASEAMLRQITEAAGADDPAALAAELVQLLQSAFTRRVVASDDAAASRARRLAELVFDARCAPADPLRG